MADPWLGLEIGHGRGEKLVDRLCKGLCHVEFDLSYFSSSEALKSQSSKDTNVLS